MANYCTPTVIQPTIPDVDMTPLERLLLSHISVPNPMATGCISMPMNVRRT